MEIFVLLLMVAAFGAWQLKSENRTRRVALLDGFLGRYQLDKRMENLIEGYLKALEEKDPERQTRLWATLALSEEQLCEQFRRFTADFSAVDEADARVSKLPAFLPETDRFFPDNTFDMRRALVVHAEAMERAAKNAQGRAPRDKAYTLSAELLLMQHTCHWYCQSKALASAHMLARHQTPYPQLLASVDPETRQAYLATIGR
ncbi:MAG: hypothetical protein Q8M93_24040 [Polaromonas sp.]|uniref:hypothetical protein n=1 Tax=Polaromonas sp. TaxID=1869339 RepID=UPI00273209C4|nr:hypothetical protein [Polaromonas sp.]MDP2450564.1 hypothetical protein [Polaromonas sp.]MDP3250021.1 hypothetical protein [Polaromonas sp.]MDP3757326.1 hypothetical protein [Polaromonas sp.]